MRPLGSPRPTSFVVSTSTAAVGVGGWKELVDTVTAPPRTLVSRPPLPVTWVAQPLVNSSTPRDRRPNRRLAVLEWFGMLTGEVFTVDETLVGKGRTWRGTGSFGIAEGKSAGISGVPGRQRRLQRPLREGSARSRPACQGRRISPSFFGARAIWASWERLAMRVASILSSSATRSRSALMRS